MSEVHIVDQNGENYRVIILSEGEQVVPARPSPDHKWRGDEWVYAKPSPPSRNIAAEANQHALALKIGAINALRTDGGAPYPVDPSVLDKVVTSYRDTTASLQVKQTKASNGRGEALSEVEWDLLEVLQTGFNYFQSVDGAVDAIVAAGDAAEPIGDDARWPTIG